MDFCPVFLKKKNEHGLTLVEIIIVVALLAILGMIVLVALNPSVQIKKSSDARRKADLQKLTRKLEDYYNDKKCYPASLICNAPLPPYVEKIPCDPKGGSYGYTSDCSSFRIYAKLEFLSDPIIEKVGCKNGCGPGGSSDYNWGVSSTNVSLEPAP
ncbi:MAG: prepilin-type N-terminal cleavage/methylation domain-containing protein [bacterium]|nr:prepilin-type N-terminal cleavage/methylation domain-containing protein [bacterium]